MRRADNGGARQKYGYCALTRRPGKLVKSHIIPEALTKPTAGSPLIQHGIEKTPSQRWSSWYDSQLVTSAGEGVLSELDSWGIRELRRLKLVWSGWQHPSELELQEKYLGPSHWIATRQVRSSDWRLLRRFLHSILWRAAASTRSEFADVSLTAEQLESLRLVVLGEFEPPELFLPMYFVQLSSKGPMHNRTPYPDVLEEPNLQGDTQAHAGIPTLRFYFDGLVVHFITEILQAAALGDLKLTLAGCFDTLHLATISYEESAVRIGLEKVVQDYNKHQAKRRPGTRV